MCGSFLIPLFSLVLLAWPISMCLSFFSAADEYDDDNVIVVLLNALPFILVLTVINAVNSNRSYFGDLLTTVRNIITGIDFTSFTGKIFFIALGLMLLFFIASLYLAARLFNQWRFSRWAERHGFKLISYKRLWRSPFSLNRSQYQSLYAMELADREGLVQNVEALVGSYWGNNPNKFEIFREDPETTKACERYLEMQSDTRFRPD